MTVFVFDDITTTSIAFNTDRDILSLSGKASDYRIIEDADGVVGISRDEKQLMLAGAEMTELISANFMVIGSDDIIRIGDNTTASVNDNLQQPGGGVLDLEAAAGRNRDGDNLLYGMGEGDTITAGSGDNIIFGGRGMVDTADGSDSITITGTQDFSGSNGIFGNAGNDTILFNKPTSSGKHSTVWGGVGDDEAVSGAAAGDLTFYGNGGSDTLNASGSSGDVMLIGGNGTVDSVDGADELYTGTGNATVYGNADNDAVRYDDFALTSTQTIYAGLGDDTVAPDAGGTGSLGALLIHGNAGDDSLDVTTHAGAATVFGGNGMVDSLDGDDVINVGMLSAAHQVVAYGNAGADTVNVINGVAGGASVEVFGGLGDDVFNVSGLRGITTSLTLHGNEGKDTFNIDDTRLPEETTLRLASFEEDDVVNVTLHGGSAIDFAISGVGSAIVLDNIAARGTYVFEGYTGSLTETNLLFNDGSFVLINTGESATLTGKEMADQIIAGNLGDTVNAGDGNDSILGGGGADSIDGAEGVDTIRGNEGNDTLMAGDGGEAGGTFDSVLEGGEGADSLIGGAFEDSLSGGTGHDTLEGGAGADQLTGGLGNDVYSFKVEEVGANVADIDTITDAFTGVDRFDFSDLTNESLRGEGTRFASGNGTALQTLNADAGLYVATNATSNFLESGVYFALSGIAGDLAIGDMFYTLMSDGTDSRLMRITNAAGAGLSDADDTLEYVATLEGITNDDLTNLNAGNFLDFS